jgi:hypothetical protein
MKKEQIKFRSTGPEGNVHHLLVLVKNALRKQHRITDYNNLRDRVLSSESYEQGLSAMREYVDLIDLDKKY